MKKWKDSVTDFFKWVKGTELVELDDRSYLSSIYSMV
jgi:hypothetical protein